MWDESFLVKTSDLEARVFPLSCSSLRFQGLAQLPGLVFSLTRSGIRIIVIIKRQEQSLPLHLRIWEDANLNLGVLTGYRN